MAQSQTSHMTDKERAEFIAIRKGPNLEQFLEGKKRKYVTYRQGAKLYDLNYYTFVKIARAAKANFQIKKNVIVDLEILDEYLENHCGEEEEENVQEK